MLIRLFFIYFVITSPVFAVESDLSAEQWLQKTTEAMKTLDYQGTVAFFKNGRLDTMKYFHAIEQGVEQERLLSLNSPMREVIREAGKVSCVFKQSDKVVVNHQPVSASFIVDLPADNNALSSVYHFSIQGEESVAMRPTIMLSIKAKDDYRYDRKIWTDKFYFLPLKMEVHDLTGQMVEQVVFSDIQVGHKLEFIHADNKFENKTVEHIQQSDALTFEQADFVLENVPAGFDVVFFTRMHMDASNQPVEHLLLSDGYSSVSVYREALTDDVQLGLQTLGSVNSYTQAFEYSQITALGEVPAKTVRFIAQGVKFH